MKTNRWVQSIWLVLAGFFIGNVELMGLNPLAVGFVGATGLLGHSYMFTYLATLLGLSLSLPLVHTIRYGIMMFGLLVLFNVKNLLQNKSNTFFMSFLGGMAAVIINLSLYYFVDGILRIEEVFLEGFIIFGATMIYHCGITVIERDYIKIVTDSQAAISVVAIATSVVVGMPVEVAGVISLMEAFALFSIMFAIFKFGFGVGISWTVICGAVVATKTGEAGYLTVWLIINVLAYGLLNLIRGSRGIFVLLFGLSYYGCGIVYYDFLLAEGSQKALLSALFFFLFAPSKLMLRVDDKVRYGELAENSPEWGRLVIDRVNSLASAFKRIDYTLASDAATGIGF
ncbi:MAG: hypothetical protein IJX12_04465, partial [Lachnospiraceae bacterium]|nr:hypothetical protein [Lachnospiraceae bacterium]